MRNEKKYEEGGTGERGGEDEGELLANYCSLSFLTPSLLPNELIEANLLFILFSGY
jgi:hypothetical protein